MIISLAYTNHYSYTYDYAGAREHGFLFEFEIDVADLGAITKVLPNPFQSTLLDGSLFSLKGRARRKQGFVTKPDLMLREVESNNETLRLYEALSRWYFARGKWINTGTKGGIQESAINAEYDSTSPTNVNPGPPSGGQGYIPSGDYEKVETEGDFTPEKFEGMLMMQRVTVEFQTTRAFSV